MDRFLRIQGMPAPKYQIENHASGLLQSLGIAIPVSVGLWIAIILLLI